MAAWCSQSPGYQLLRRARTTRVRLQTGENLVDAQVVSLTLPKVRNHFVARSLEQLQGGNKPIADSSRLVCVSTDGDGNAAVVHLDKHGRERIHLGNDLVGSGRVQFHGGAGSSDTVQATCRCRT